MTEWMEALAKESLPSRAGIYTTAARLRAAAKIIEAADKADDLAFTSDELVLALDKLRDLVEE